MNLSEIQALVFKEYEKNGYLEMWFQARMALARIGYAGLEDLAELGLVDSEVTEAMEAIRLSAKKDLGPELADVVIRVLNFASRHKINIEKEILAKHRKNMKRPMLHGKKI